MMLQLRSVKTGLFFFVFLSTSSLVFMAGATAHADSHVRIVGPSEIAVKKCTRFEAVLLRHRHPDKGAGLGSPPLDLALRGVDGQFFSDPACQQKQPIHAGTLKDPGLFYVEAYALPHRHRFAKIVARIRAHGYRVVSKKIRVIPGVSPIPSPAPSSIPSPMPSPSVLPSFAPSPAPIPAPSSAPNPVPSALPSFAPSPAPIPAPSPIASVYLTRPPSVFCNVYVASATGIQSTLDAGASVVCVQAGLYRISSPLKINPGQTLYGVDGAILNGSVVINPTLSGTYYVADVPGFNSSAAGAGNCQDATAPNCYVPNDVYVDGVLYPKAASLAALITGQAYLDTSALKVYLLDNPAGKTVEYSVATAAVGGGSGSVLEGFVIEKFANDSATGAVDGSAGLSVQYNEIRLTHGVGLYGGPLSAHNFIHHHGLIGIGTIPGFDGAVFDSNEIAYNNTAGYRSNWNGGASNFWKATHIVVKNSLIHDNHGRGLWDSTNSTVTYQGNIVSGNQSDGIVHEIGYQALISGNTLSNNGWGDAAVDTAGCAISVDTSEQTSVSGNTLTANHGAICLHASARSDEGVFHYLQNNSVSANIVGFSLNSTFEGILPYGTPYNDPFSAGNVFTGNQYTFADTANHFYWSAGSASYSQWRAFGNQ